MSSIHIMRHSTLQQTRLRHRRHRLMMTAGMVGISLAGIAIAGFGADRWLAVQTINVRGASGVSAPDIERTAWESIKKNTIFRRNIVGMNTRALRVALLDRFPAIRDIRTERDLVSRRLIVTTEERALWAEWCNSGECMYVDTNGIAFAFVPQSSFLPLLQINDSGAAAAPLGSAVYNSIEIGIIQTFIRSVESLGIDVGRVERLPEGELDFITSARWTLILDSRTDPEIAAANLAALVAGPLKNQHSIDYIDLRLPEKAFYKLR
ncbi:MAG: hypothetical protein HYT22_02625 [Candidatus Niyogibacteria bacterium]|nr:hypothetical protein [Candidatus Niyogibacteria bacterium]